MKRVLFFVLLLFCLQALPLRAGVGQGPWTGEVRETSLTLLWLSEAPGMAWVELEDGSCHWETFAGRRIFHRLHRIRLEGLAPGSVVRYRVCGQDLVDDRNARKPVFGDIYQGEWHQVRLFDSKAETCRFSVFNDIHMRRKDYCALAAQVDSAATDFLFLNGDIVSAGNYQADTLVHYAIAPLGNLPAGIPLLFARGNHEGRGNAVELVSEVFPNSSPAPFYYTFRQGPVAFIVFDAGETGESRAILFSGKSVYEDYLFEQIEWAKQAVRDPLFSEAPVKICLIHVPMIDHQDKTDFLLQRWLNVHVVPLLNQAGLDLMIGADLHEFMWCEPGAMANDFPILVNDEDRHLACVCTRNAITVKILNPKGKLEFERTIKL